MVLSNENSKINFLVGFTGLKYEKETLALGKEKPKDENNDSDMENIDNEKLIKEISGSGLTNTEPFSTPSGWEIQWETEGDIFQVYLYNLSGEMVGILANQQGSGKGSSYQAKSGRFYLQINAIGEWKISIVKKSPQIYKGSDLSFSGTGLHNSAPFTVSSGWKINWSASGDIFQVYLYDLNGNLINVLANQQGSGQGSSFYPKAGKYYLQINAIGEWEININEIK